MPLIKMSSTTLSLIPTARSKTIAMHETWRSTKNKFYGSDSKGEGHVGGVPFRNSRVS